MLWIRARNRALLKGREFDIEVSDIIIPEKCKYLDLTLECHIGKARANSPALDRIDNTKGYIKGNIQVISNLANQMKSYATEEQIKLFCQRMLVTLG
jgi:hypothetical protein